MHFNREGSQMKTIKRIIHLQICLDIFPISYLFVNRIHTHPVTFLDMENNAMYQ